MADEGNDSNSGSALDRYLKKQAAAAAGESAAAPAERPADPGLNLNINPQSRPQYEPAGFWRRGAASTIDGVILMILKSVISVPVTVVLTIFFRAPDTSGSGIPSMNFVGTALNLLASFILAIIAIYYYYGWFYANKGATPGKLVLDLKVLDSRTGTYLDRATTMKRELVGKAILGTVTFGIGYLMAAFSEDKRALHDKVFDTRVVRVRKGQ